MPEAAITLELELTQGYKHITLCVQGVCNSWENWDLKFLGALALFMTKCVAHMESLFRKTFRKRAVGTVGGFLRTKSAQFMLRCEMMGGRSIAWRPCQCIFQILAPSMFARSQLENFTSEGLQAMDAMNNAYSILRIRGAHAYFQIEAYEAAFVATMLEHEA